MTVAMARPNARPPWRADRGGDEDEGGSATSVIAGEFTTAAEPALWEMLYGSLGFHIEDDEATGFSTRKFGSPVRAREAGLGPGQRTADHAGLAACSTATLPIPGTSPSSSACSPHRK